MNRRNCRHRAVFLLALSASLALALPGHSDPPAQFVKSVQFSYDSGATWTDVPASGVVPVLQEGGTTFRAHKGVPDQPWPETPTFLPFWEDITKSTTSDGPRFMGEQITLQYMKVAKTSDPKAPPANVLAVTCGSTVQVYPLVIPNVTLEVKPATDGIPGTLAEAPTNDPATDQITVIVTDANRDPAPGIAVHLETNSGSFNTKGDQTIDLKSDAKGEAVATLRAGPSGLNAKVRATVHQPLEGTVTANAHIFMQ